VWGNSRSLLIMVAVALLLHGLLLAWWEFPQPEFIPHSERTIVQIIKVNQIDPSTPELPPAKPLPASIAEPPAKPQPRPEPKPLPAPESMTLEPNPLPTEQEPLPAVRTPVSPEFLPLPVSEAIAAEIVLSPQPPPDVVMRYKAQLAAWLDRHKYYPLQAQRRRQEGEALLWIRINRDGGVLSFQLQELSDHRILNESALSMVNRADPFPAFPDDFPGTEFEFIAPVSFRLR
jgi:periplasmic protein TonB